VDCPMLLYLTKASFLTDLVSIAIFIIVLIVIPHGKTTFHNKNSEEN